MKAQSPLQVVDVDRLLGGLVITFDDGEAAIYSASLLRASLDQAQRITARKIKVTLKTRPPE